MTKYEKNRAQEVQREQFRLVKVERILTKILAQVNESLNELKVEELHIKSNLVEHYTSNHNDEEPSTSAQAALRLKSANLTKVDPLSIQQAESTIDMEGVEDINNQILTLESLIVPHTQKKFNEEEDDDDFDHADVSESGKEN